MGSSGGGRGPCGHEGGVEHIGEVITQRVAMVAPRSGESDRTPPGQPCRIPLVPSLANDACPFCSLGPDRVVAEDELTRTVCDAYPVSPGHTLVMPRRHVASFFDMTEVEQAAVLAAVRVATVALDAELRPDGFNVGVNVGVAAGQTVMHAHVHVIPRFLGDVADPRGGVRYCIPAKGRYEPTP